jgi:hypothetical protein
VKEYPLSSRVGDAKGKLVAFHVPVPQADPKALAWMQAEVSAPRPKPGMLSKPMSLVKNGPEKEIRNSSRLGAPQMEPENDTTSAADILTGGGKTQIGSGSPGKLGDANSSPGNTAVVEIATPQSGASGGSTVENGDTGSGAAPAATGETPGDTSGTAPPSAPAAENPPAANTDTSNPPAATAGTDTTGATGNGTTAAADANAKPADNTADPQKESTSKKKKGLKKIIPW